MASRAEAPAGAGRPAGRWRAFWPALNLLAVLLIVALDWLTPAGVVVGILLTVPIILTSVHPSARLVWVTAGVATVGFLLAAGYGRGPIAPEQVWIPNRIFAFLTLPASAFLARLLQRRRRQAESARDAALAAGELNRLLMSLLAHDLRSPLTLAVQGLDYVTDATRSGRPLDEALIVDLRARLQRSLRAVEVVLDVAREAREEHHRQPGGVELERVGGEIAAEVDSFAGEAVHRGKTLVARLEGLERAEAGARVDALVLRQALAVLLDNAIRHGVPGEVAVAAVREGAELVVRVRDRGPGLSAPSPSRGGAGLGLELARNLVARVGGRLEVERDAPSGTEFALRLPIRPR